MLRKLWAAEQKLVKKNAPELRRLRADLGGREWVGSENVMVCESCTQPPLATLWYYSILARDFRCEHPSESVTARSIRGGRNGPRAATMDQIKSLSAALLIYVTQRIIVSAVIIFTALLAATL
jgi:hypothetical protein